MRRLAAEAGLGLGPVGVEQLALDLAQGAVDDLAGDRIEGALAEPHATEALGQVELASLAVVLRALLGAVGVDDHRPAVARRLEVHEPVRAGEVEQPLVAVPIELLDGAGGAGSQAGW